jgi:hypothetical protein
MAKRTISGCQEPTSPNKTISAFGKALRQLWNAAVCTFSVGGLQGFGLARMSKASGWAALTEFLWVVKSIKILRKKFRDKVRSPGVI